MNRVVQRAFHGPEYFVCSRECVEASGVIFYSSSFLTSDGTVTKSENESEVWFSVRVAQTDYF